MSRRKMKSERIRIRVRVRGKGGEREESGRGEVRVRVREWRGGTENVVVVGAEVLVREEGGEGGEVPWGPLGAPWGILIGLKDFIKDAHHLLYLRRI